MAAKQTGETSKERRILVLGSAPHTRLVKAYEWDKLPADLNVADFDTVIMDFVPFANLEFAKGVNIDTMPSWQQFARHVFSADSEVIVIGSPAFQLGSNPFRLPTWWLPVDLGFSYEKGTEIRNVDEQFSFYFNLVREWSFYLEGIADEHSDFLQMYLNLGAPGRYSIQPQIVPIAETRFGRAIGFRLAVVAYAKSNNRVGSLSTHILWLPATTEVSSHEAVDLILREMYGLRFEKEPPNWVAEYSLPSEYPIEQVVSEKEIAITKLVSELDEARSQLKRASRFRKLLYEQGEDVLEPVVRDALRELGATVEDPKKKGREDGRVTDPMNRNGMLEVKGRSGDLRLSDVRELDNWVRDAMANEGWHSKGILVANLQCDTEPSRRKDLFPKNCLEAARVFGVSILTTSQLFCALVDDQKKELDRKRFWETVFTSVGLCDLPEL